jgi:hypothetical protein
LAFVYKTDYDTPVTSTTSEYVTGSVIFVPLVVQAKKKTMTSGKTNKKRFIRHSL